MDSIIKVHSYFYIGKSFLASKLSKKTLPLGYSVSTVGLSALYPKDLQNENAVVFLDTAGTETPVNDFLRDRSVTSKEMIK
jgi:hypothetical protein